MQTALDLLNYMQQTMADLQKKAKYDHEDKVVIIDTCDFDLFKTKMLVTTSRLTQMSIRPD